MAYRGSLTAAEADELGRPVRHLLYGKRTGVYRIIFDIQEASEEGPRARVLRIWHGARDHHQRRGYRTRVLTPCALWLRQLQ